MLISQLPDQVLSNIVSSVCNSTAVIQLWICGNQLLNNKLARGGCSSFIMRYKDGQERILPGILGHLRSLRVLRIWTWSLGDNQNKLLPTLSLLSQLVELRLETLYGNWMLLDRSSADDGSIAALLPDTRVSGAIALTIDLATMFPLLETLCLEDHSSAYYPPLGPQSFALLPPHLTYLQWGAEWLNEHTFSQTDSTEVGFSLLPRSLTHLHLVSFHSIDDLETLPPGLTKLRGRLYQQLDEDKLKALPRSMTSFGRDLSLPLWTPAIAAALPPGIKRLSSMWTGSDSLEDQWIATLPHQLTRLALPLYALTPGAIAILPRTLLRLDQLYFDAQACKPILEALAGKVDFNSNLLSWPPNICKLSLGSQSRLSPIIPFLPRSATIVDGIMEAEITRPFPLPPGLVKLAINFDMRYDRPTIAFGYPIPASLRHLSMPDSSRDLDNIGMLPSHLAYFSVDRHVLQDHKPLPRFLRTLIVTSVSLESFPLLPPHLEKLTCRYTPSEALLPEDSYYDDEGEDDTEKVLRPCSAFKLLPASLRKLRIDVSKFHADILRHLPTGLRKLEINVSLPFDEMELFWPSLPPSSYKWVDSLMKHDVCTSLEEYRASLTA